MNRFIEVQDRTYGKQMINLDNVEILSEKSYEVVMTGGKRFKIIKDSFDKLLSELKKPYSDATAEKMCQLQNDLTISKDVITNIYLLLMDSSISPSVLGKVNDSELQSMAAKCYTEIKKLQNR
jgi:hypothetical protein|nr:hypothetical protein [uncultured Prevotella sp.]